MTFALVGSALPLLIFGVCLRNTPPASQFKESRRRVFGRHEAGYVVAETLLKRVFERLLRVAHGCDLQPFAKVGRAGAEIHRRHRLAAFRAERDRVLVERGIQRPSEADRIRVVMLVGKRLIDAND